MTESPEQAPRTAPGRASLRALGLRSLRLAGRPWWHWAIVVGLAVGVSVFEGAGAIILYGLLGMITDPSGGFVVPLVGEVANPVAGEDRDRLYLLAAGLIAAFFLLRGLIVIVQTHVLVRVTERAGADLAARLHRGYLRAPYSGRGADDLALQVRNAHDTTQRFVDGVLIPAVTLFSELILVVALLAVLVFTAPVASALVVAVVLPVVLVLNRIVQPRLGALGRRTQTLSRDSLAALSESLEGRDDIRMAGATDTFNRTFARIRRDFATTSHRRWTLAKLPPVGLETALVWFIVLLLAGTVVSGGEVTSILPVLGLFGYTGLRLIPSLERAVTAVNMLRYSAAAVDDLTAEHERVAAWVSADVDGAAPLELRHVLVGDRLRYRYPDTERDAIDGIDLRLTAGSFVGIVGTTGGGKSSLVELLVGLRRPDEGVLQVDGIDVHADPYRWQRSVGYVAQQAFLIDDTLRRNIALGVDDEHIDDERIGDAVSDAQLDQVVDQLTDGLATVVGLRGQRLSGGQRQRVAIARVLYRRPSVLVLDEATSALDAATEAALLSCLRARHADRTLIVVTHRVATLGSCDEILVIDESRLAARGTFTELAKQHPGFQALLEQPRS